LDFSRIVAGPYCGQILADLGAEVIKIEDPGGEPLRFGSPTHKGLASAFAQYNRGKKGVTLDLKSETDRALARKLADTADIVIENFRPGVMEKLGLGYDDLRRTNPGLIYVQISGFGESGPYVSRPAYDQVIQAMTGLMPIQGGSGRPQAILNSVVDKVTAIWAANAAVAALLHRERSGGIGQKVSTDLLSAYSSFLMPELLFDHSFPNENLPPALKVNFHQPLATSDSYVMGLPMTRGQFEGICKVVDRPELIDDPRFETLTDLLTNISALYEEIQPNMLTMTADEFLARTADYDVPFAKVVDVNGFFENEQVRHSGCYVDYDDPELGVIRQLNHPVRYERSPVDIAKRAPRLGEHNAEILGSLS
jgi:formyl-CoA transferase